MAAKTVEQQSNSQTRNETADTPVVDETAEIKALIKRGKERGYVTYDELNAALPSEQVSSEQIEDTMAILSEMGINVVENEEAEEGGAQASEQEEGRAASGNLDDDPGRTDDPVRMYLREMGSVELLSREGEIAIAKRIEAGRIKMISALCRSPLTVNAVVEWGRRLEAGEIMLREFIDLEATLAADPTIQPARNASNGTEEGAINGAALNGHAAVTPINGAATAAHAEDQDDDEDDADETEEDEDESVDTEAAKDDDDDEFENNLSLAAMEQALLPGVTAALAAVTDLQPGVIALQQSRLAEMEGLEELTAEARRNYAALQAAMAERMAAIKLNNNKIELLMEDLYTRNKQIVAVSYTHLRAHETR